MPILEGKTDITKTKFARARGRVTELTAKPLLNFFFPEISFEQPLSGQFAARKEILKRINFEKDYGVDVGIVIDADVLGISIMEVDIGEIEHDMSPLADLNLMANEVVRTIISRANKYGRVIMIDDIGQYIRMSIVGLSLVILGLFTIFFVKFVPLAFGVIISILGIVMAVYYIIKVIVQSVLMFKKTPRGNLFKSFIKIHFPLIISIIILLLMISTFIGAAHFENGVLSIEPNSRNLIIYADDASRGKYVIEDTRDGEQDILRLPKEARKFLDVDIGNVIQNSRLKEVFEGSVITHSFENENQSFQEQFIVSSRDKQADIFEVIVDNVSVGTSRGIFKNSSYHISVNGEEITTIGKLNSTNFTYDDHDIQLIFNETNSTSIKQYVRNDQGTFLNLILN